MKLRLNTIVELRGDFSEERFKVLKSENPNGRLVVKDEEQQIFMATIKDLEILKEIKEESSKDPSD